MSNQVRIETVRLAADARRPQPLPVLRLGFRPFYWCAALFAAVAVPLWVGRYLGGPVPAPRAFPEYFWHAHEMVFGFALAVVVGFLFTAVRNWTGVDTPTGSHLAELVLLWAIARVLAWTGPLLPAALASVGFIVCAAAALGRVLYRARNRRNYFVAALLLAFALLDALFFAAAGGTLPLPPLVPIRLAILLLVFLVTVIGGRVIPMFTQNATGVPIARSAVLDRAAPGLLLAAIAGQALVLPPAVEAGLCFAAAAVHGVRLLSWRPWLARSRPILWVLHLAYAWIPLGLFLLGLAQLGRFPPILALHALTVGAMGGMIAGMITRTALGHTGRPLQAGYAGTVFYVLMLLAALVRVLGSALFPAGHALWLALSAVCWCSAFAVYLIAYTPVLWRPRADGLPG
ncbi:MAG: NnrS family protein [Nevskia sp.]|nr:NnrS family protein [Nevskia sp.]